MYEDGRWKMEDGSMRSEDGSMRYELKGQASMKCLLSLRHEGAKE
jgi:hypothetical protein